MENVKPVEMEEVTKIEFPEIHLCKLCSYQISIEASYLHTELEFKGLELNNNYMVTKKDRWEDEDEEINLHKHID